MSEPSSIATRKSQLENPLVLIRSTANRQHVVHVSDEAAAFGIRPGMTLAQARASCAHVYPIEHQPHRDMIALEAIARWLTRFSPVVSIEGGLPISDCRVSNEKQARVQSFCQGERLVLQSAAAHPRDQLRVRPGSKSAIENQQSAIYIDLTGSQYVFGSYDNILAQIHAAITRFGLRACIAVAPTVGAAYALTFESPRRHGCTERRDFRSPISDCRYSQIADRKSQMNPIRADSCGLVDALSDLPPATLRLDDHIVAMLTHLGITTIGLLRKLPRDQLPSRFGPTILKRLNQALGLEPEPLVPVRTVEPIAAGIEFDFGVDSLESLWVVIEEQLKQIIQQLVRRGHGARVIEFDLLLQNQKPMTRTIELSRPTRDLKRIFRLVRLTLDSPLPVREGVGGGVAGLGRTSRAYQATPHPTLPLKGGGKKRVRQLLGDRFTGVRFRVTQSIRIRDQQIALLDRNDLADETAIADLLERLTLRLKEDVFQVQTIESYVPERAWNQAAETNVPQRRRDAENTHFRLPISNCQLGSQQSAIGNWQSAFGLIREDSCRFVERFSNRPLSLSDQPHEIAVIVSPSHDRDGRPVAVTINGHHHRVLHARGPERLSGEWWVGHNKTRDYFDIELETAARLWVFRVVENGRWFLHGEY